MSHAPFHALYLGKKHNQYISSASTTTIKTLKTCTTDSRCCLSIFPDSSLPALIVFLSLQGWINSPRSCETLTPLITTSCSTFCPECPQMYKWWVNFPFSFLFHLSYLSDHTSVSSVHRQGWGLLLLSPGLCLFSPPLSYWHLTVVLFQQGELTGHADIWSYCFKVVPGFS